MTVWFKIDGKEYEVEQFKIGFSQPSDFKGEPQSEIKGEQLHCTNRSMSGQLSQKKKKTSR